MNTGIRTQRVMNTNTPGLAPIEPLPAIPAPQPVPPAAPEAVLVVHDSQNGVEAQYEIMPGRELTVGADPACDVPIEDPYLSSRHFTVSIDDGRVVVKDQESRNGTYFKITELVEVPVGQKILAGKTLFSVNEPGNSGHAE